MQSRYLPGMHVNDDIAQVSVFHLRQSYFQNNIYFLKSNKYASVVFQMPHAYISRRETYIPLPHLLNFLLK